MELVGWVGAICFAMCAVPQAWQSYKTKSSKGLNAWTLTLWFAGEIFTIVYILGTTVQLPLLFNYVFNLLCLIVIIYYKIREKR
jgi:uncharacterized protein with PQ loop repeat